MNQHSRIDHEQITPTVDTEDIEFIIPMDTFSGSPAGFAFAP